MSEIDRIKAELLRTPAKWLVTGVAGFIGSNLAETLIEMDQQVIGLDNFSTGHRHNLESVERTVGGKRWTNFNFKEGDIRSLDDCRLACKDVDYVLHQAALGSVPRSIDDPISTHRSNVDGFLNMIIAAKEAGVKRFVYASSSSVYGDSEQLPRTEEVIGNSLSPYATSKLVNELYAGVFARVYGMETVGLRYFNVYGKRQDPKGAYAAVIPRWTHALLNFQPPVINGDGETSRDFCYVRDVIKANVLAAVCGNPESVNRVYNIAFGERTTLNELFKLIRSALAAYIPEVMKISAHYGPFRRGDVRHSLADTGQANRLIGFVPEYSIREGIEETMKWYVRDLRRE